MFRESCCNFNSWVRFSDVKGEEDADSRQRPLKKFSVFVGQIPFNAKKEEVHKMFEDIAKPGI